jgi:hypothetical protein
MGRQGLATIRPESQRTGFVPSEKTSRTNACPGGSQENLLVTHTLDPANARAHLNCSIRRASGFVQTPFSSEADQEPEDF